MIACALGKHEPSKQERFWHTSELKDVLEGIGVVPKREITLMAPCPALKSGKSRAEFQQRSNPHSIVPLPVKVGSQRGEGNSDDAQVSDAMQVAAQPIFDGHIAMLNGEHDVVLHSPDFDSAYALRVQLNSCKILHIEHCIQVNNVVPTMVIAQNGYAPTKHHPSDLDPITMTPQQVYTLTTCRMSSMSDVTSQSVTDTVSRNGRRFRRPTSTLRPIQRETQKSFDIIFADRAWRPYDGVLVNEAIARRISHDPGCIPTCNIICIYTSKAGTTVQIRANVWDQAWYGTLTIHHCHCRSRRMINLSRQHLAAPTSSDASYQ